ncbi:MAG TPA: hypothetical protein VGI98_00930 [Candidatus Limnocylindrales bacterium]|jgi:hypothetical protein
MSGLLVLGAIVGIIVVFDVLVAAFGKDSRPDFAERFGALS